MSGTPLGGKRAAETNKKLHGADFYKRIGSRGGKARGPKGFAMMDPTRHLELSTKGGETSSRAGIRNKVRSTEAA